MHDQHISIDTSRIIYDNSNRSRRRKHSHNHIHVDRHSHHHNNKNHNDTLNNHHNQHHKSHSNHNNHYKRHKYHSTAALRHCPRSTGLKARPRGSASQRFPRHKRSSNSCWKQLPLSLQPLVLLIQSLRCPIRRSTSCSKSDNARKHISTNWTPPHLISSIS